jgi:hypothetical protein
MNMRSVPSVQNTQPFIRRESAFASLAQKPVHIRQCADSPANSDTVNVKYYFISPFTQRNQDLAS